jgi:hypothetical protein
MTRRILSASMVLAVAFSASSAFASPFHLHKTADVSAMVKTKHLTVNFRNDTKTPVTITAGDKDMTLAPGQTQTAKLVSGDKILAGAGSSQAPGTVLAVIAPELADATVVLH